MFDLFTKLGPARIAAIASTALLLIGFFVFMMFRVTTPEYALLFSNLEPDAVRNIAEKLSAQGIKFDIRDENKEIWVPDDVVSDLRLSLASDGLVGSVLGYEIFDRDTALGQSNLVQEVNRLRALEGELARTINNFEVVSSTRVHIVLPKRELFTRDKQKTKASVILNLKRGETLNKEQVKAIQHLIATAVPDLDPQNITVADSKGILLHAGGDTDGSMLSLTEGNEMRAAYEREVAIKVTQLLEGTVGFGKVRVEVYADMDFSEQVENTHQFNPDQQVAISERTIVEGARSSEGGDGTVSVSNNLPDAEQFVSNAAGIQESSNRTEELVNYEIGRSNINRVVPPGRLNRLSVAVVIDGSYTEDGENNFIYQPRGEEELEVLTELVKSAVGFDETRGDEIELANMQFVDAIPETVPIEETYFGFEIDEIKRYLEYIALTGVFIVVMLLVVRPLVLRILDFRDVIEDQMEEEKSKPRVVLNQYGQVVEVRKDEDVPATEAAGADQALESLIDIAHVEGQIKASSLRKIGELIDKHPEEAVTILRQWMYQDERP